MTGNKRFGWDTALGKVYDYDKPVASTFESYQEWELVELLNSLSEENEQLIKDYFKVRDIASNLKNENNLLKQKLAEEMKENYGNLDGINYYQEENASLGERISDLECENVQLKQTMKEVAELLSDEVDLFSDKAIEHDINAYIELKELDNKDAYYMAKATKTAIKMLKCDVE